MDKEITDTFERIWQAISRIDKELAVTCHMLRSDKEEMLHRIRDIRGDIISLGKGFGKLEAKFDKHIDDKIALYEEIQKEKTEQLLQAKDRKNNRKIAFLGGFFAIVVVVIEILLPMAFE